MNDLVAFLRARIDEDEQTARACPPWPWAANAEADEVLAADGVQVADVFALSSEQMRHTTAHIARHDPTRVLAEVDAKRRIIAEHHPVDPCDAHDASMRTVACETLRLLAAPHREHPDYRQEWAA